MAAKRERRILLAAGLELVERDQEENAELVLHVEPVIGKAILELPPEDRVRLEEWLRNDAELAAGLVLKRRGVPTGA